MTTTAPSRIDSPALPEPEQEPRASERTRSAVSRVSRLPALDGLRALAVLAVVAFHSGASWAPGGLLGVDVFFVLSGYLITGLLLAEHASIGRISLAAFWGRRARRLLPALLLLVAAVLAVWRVFGLPGGGTLRDDCLATLGYVANWHQAFAGQDYFSRGAAPSPLLHMWSLGVEEQFYVVWPLLVVRVFALSRRRTTRIVQRRVAVLAATGAVASAVLMAVLAALGAGTSRLYYGSDTHASALLVGAALAAAVPLTRSRQAAAGQQPMRRRLAALLAGVLAGVPAVLAFAGVVAAVALVPGTARGLYYGGFLAVAVGVAIVVSAVVRRPASLGARLLALPPLAALGRASYGVYLWHWPAVLLLNHERTGLSGSALLVVRVAASVALGALSWCCVERVFLRAAPGARPRAVLAPAVAALTGVVAVVLLVPPPPQAAAVPRLADLERSQTQVLPPVAASVPVAERRPRVVLVGDSVAVTLGYGLMPAARAAGVDVVSRGALGCGIATAGESSDGAHTFPPATACAAWPQTWGAALDQQQADILAVLVGRWELTDRYLHGRWQHIGDPDLDAYLAERLDAVAALGVSHHVKVAFLTAPCFRGGELADGSSSVMDQPARVERWNQLVAEAVGRHPNDTRLADVHGALCPTGTFSAAVDGVLARWDDGIHLTAGGGRLVARTLVPELMSLARPPIPRNVS